ncbi:hypothetical protein BCR39DRAFT_534704 [Naematelia encephala]|uniref:Uncharacterized protein n=1 Tax=Naematelia encephala TaxID=71784 RepID=A0A1Y2B0T2_9TREE|nr:hypothetical protein BCR39DRAFT_534704 [Naematelia encephala]
MSQPASKTSVLLSFQHGRTSSYLSPFRFYTSTRAEQNKPTRTSLRLVFLLLLLFSLSPLNPPPRFFSLFFSGLSLGISARSTKSLLVRLPLSTLFFWPEGRDI